MTLSYWRDTTRLLIRDNLLNRLAIFRVILKPLKFILDQRLQNVMHRSWFEDRLSVILIFLIYL